MLIESVDSELAAQLAETSVLSLYGVDHRYPGDRREVSMDEAEESINLMREARNAVLAALPSHAH